MIPRYTRPEMAALWSPDAASAAGWTWSWPRLRGDGAPGRRRRGLRPLERAFAGFEFGPADVARIEEIERTTKHDVIAFLTFLEERVGLAAPAAPGDDVLGRARHVAGGAAAASVDLLLLAD